jgi:hypothetical protein
MPVLSAAILLLFQVDAKPKGFTKQSQSIRGAETRIRPADDHHGGANWLQYIEP